MYCIVCGNHEVTKEKPLCRYCYFAARTEYALTRSVRERQIARNATKDLPLARAFDCETCGKPAQEYHHTDYNKPLEVIKMCRPCHRQLHSRLVIRKVKKDVAMARNAQVINPHFLGC